MRLNTEWMRTDWGIIMLIVLGALLGMQLAFWICPMMVTCQTVYYGEFPKANISVNYTELNETLRGLG